MKNQKIITSANFEKAKQLARKIKKHDNIPHHEALDIVRAILGFESWEQLVSIHKYSCKKFKNKSIIIAYDMADGIEIVDWRLFPRVKPIQKFLEANKEQWIDEGSTHSEMLEHIESAYETFCLNPLIDNTSLAYLVELLSEVCFFFPFFIWINDELTNLEEVTIDVQDLLNYHIETFG